MTAEILAWLGGDPRRITLFEAVEAAVLALGESAPAVAKTQISWGNPKKFAMISLPRRAGAGGLILTLGLGRRAEDPCVFQAVEPYPGRWTHHIALAGPEDVDNAVRALLAEAYTFALNKKRRTYR